MSASDLSRRSVLAGLAAISCGRKPDPEPSPPYSPPLVGPARNLIVVQAYGGWDTTWSIDPKPGLPSFDIPEGELMQFGNLPLWAHPSRPKSARLFDRHHDRIAVVHGINVRSVDHAQCLRWMLTGTRDTMAPDLCSILAHEHGGDLPIPYLLLSDRAFLGGFGGEAARAGGSNQIAALADPLQRFMPLDGTIPVDLTDPERSAVDAFREARRASPSGVVGGLAAERLDAVAARERAKILRSVSGWLGTAGVPQDLDGQIQTALMLLEGGLTRAVMLDSLEYFDTHGRNDEQLTAQESTFEAVDGLLTQLALRPGRSGGSLLDETLVAVISEMGRTPLLNDNQGKDHWPFASILLAGGSVVGDRTYGGTGEDFLGLPVDLATALPSPAGVSLSAENVTAGLLAAIGVDPRPWLGELPALQGFYR